MREKTPYLEKLLATNLSLSAHKRPISLKRRIFGNFWRIFSKLTFAQKLFISALALTLPAQALTLADFKMLIDQKNYEQICTVTALNFARNRMDESLLSAYADACARMDYINRLSVPIALLRNSHEGRSNALLFATLLYKKKLLQLALLDGMDVSVFKLPRVEYELSEIYDAYAQGKFQKNGNVYELQMGGKLYRMWADHAATPPRVVVEIIQGESKIVKEYF